MTRSTLVLLLLAAAAGSWLITQDKSWDEWSTLLPWQQTETFAVASRSLDSTVSGSAIRIATFDLNEFGGKQLDDEALLDRFCFASRPFDVIALQNIVSREAYIVPSLIDALRSRGFPFDGVVGERTGREPPGQQFAFLFRTDRVQLNRSSVYSVLDPDDLLTYEPLVASFRVLGPSPGEAFTFTLVNVRVSTSITEGEREREWLWQVWQAVLANGRGEDDVILLGNFGAAAAEIERNMPSKDLAMALVERSTDITGTAQPVNLLFSRRATKEFTGRSGVLDFVREFNLSLTEAQRLSHTLPTWAEFSQREGGF